MINYIRNKYSRGYTLIEVMISVAIFGIIGAVLFGDTPSIGKAVAFNTEANLITDIVRDIQIKGSSGYVGTNDNVASSTNWTGLGLTFSTVNNSIIVFADKKNSAINERGVYEGNKYFDVNDKEIIFSVSSGVSVKDSNSVWNIELKESKINRIFIGEKLLASTTSSGGVTDKIQASVVFQRGDTKAYITDLTISDRDSTTSPIFIELISQKLSAYRCVVIEYSGSARVENGKCVLYGSITRNATAVSGDIYTETSADNRAGVTNTGTVFGGSSPVGGDNVVSGGAGRPVVTVNNNQNNNNNASPVNGVSTGNNTGNNNGVSAGGGVVYTIKVDGDGDGKIDINNINELNNIRYNISGKSYKTSFSDYGNSNGCPSTGCNGYELMRDLDFNNKNDYGDNEILFNSIYANTENIKNNLKGWEPIGGADSGCTNNNSFTAVFDGNNKTIKNLYINGSSGSPINRANYLGLFGCSNDANIKNININEIRIRAGGNYVGSIVGYASNTILTNIKIENKILTGEAIQSSERLPTKPELSSINIFDIESMSAVEIKFNSISAGFSHTCGVTENGAVKCWGDNTYGQLGDGGTVNSLSPISTIGIDGVYTSAIAVSSGDYYSCAILTTGAVKCWGDNTYGQLGNVNTISSLTPTSTIGIDGISASATAISAGKYHACAILTTKAVKCWGDNAWGQSENGGVTNAIAISSGDYNSCAILTTRAVKCWGLWEIFGLTLDRGITNAIDISIVKGWFNICAVLSTGIVECWGDNGFGLSTNVDITNAVAISAGSLSYCAILTTGAVKCWGFIGTLSSPLDIDGISASATAISTGKYHACAILTTKAVKCWGTNNESGQLGNGGTSNISTTVVEFTRTSLNISIIESFINGVNNVFYNLYNSIKNIFNNILGGILDLFNSFKSDSNTINYISGQNYVGGLAGYITGDKKILHNNFSPLSQGRQHICLLFRIGKIECSGDNTVGQLGNGDITNAIAVSAGWSHTCAIIATGAVKCWGSLSSPVDIDGVSSSAIAVSSGDYSSCAILTTGAVKCWGGLISPVEIDGVSASATAISSGEGSSCAIITTGAVKCWTPQAITSIVDIDGISASATAITSGWYHSCAILTTKAVKCWGANWWGQSENGGVTNAIAISASRHHTCALLTTGAVKCWGGISSPSNIDGISASAVAISAGHSSSCALLTTGIVECWGSNVIDMTRINSMGYGSSIISNTNSDIAYNKSSILNTIASINIGTSSDIGATHNNRAGIVGYTNKVDVSSSSWIGYIWGGNNIGGIVGSIFDSKIINTLSRGYIINNGNVENIGRLIGYSNFSNIINSTVGTSTLNKSPLTGKNAIGYLVGYANKTNIVGSTVNITNESLRTSNYIKTPTTGAGGIVGVASSSNINNNAVIDNISISSINGTNTNLGGIVGVISGSSTVKNNIINGVDIIGSAGDDIGGLIGYVLSSNLLNSNTLDNNYWSTQNKQATGTVRTNIGDKRAIGNISSSTILAKTILSQNDIINIFTNINNNNILNTSIFNNYDKFLQKFTE